MCVPNWDVKQLTLLSGSRAGSAMQLIVLFPAWVLDIGRQVLYIDSSTTLLHKNSSLDGVLLAYYSHEDGLLLFCCSELLANYNTTRMFPSSSTASYLQSRIQAQGNPLYSVFYVHPHIHNYI